MNIKILVFISIIFSNCFIAGMQQLPTNQLHYRHATIKDLPQLLTLIDTHAIHDRTKIVILPKKFREKSLQTAIEKKRIFIAEENEIIVGYKKIFIIEDNDEKNEILANEIRCINNENNCAFAGSVNENGTFIVNESPLPSDCYHVCIYNGGDFTVPTHRGKGINAQLTKNALLSCITDIKNQILQQKTSSITMLYGITKANAGEQPGAVCDRTVNIIKQFKSFIQAVGIDQNSIVLQHRRYTAFMPTFDPEAAILRPLPDEQSIPGFGCVLTYRIKESHE